ncbi:alkaline phosphatase D family protein [Jiangella alba]|uniref:alkaline phosphatase D family protein n=1 Tax=Jiangella alba TaxID=561176 RepID=UPI001C0CBB12|nr:alkaline phosphatase D family protein [Jiangella alba]
MTEARLNRRTFLQLSGVSSAALALGVAAPAQALAAAEAENAQVPDGVFGLGVASGDPSTGSVVLWTRLAPQPLAPDGHGGMPPHPVPVRYEVATDEAFRQVVRRGAAVASPELAHSVHPQVDGLDPGREYYYRFHVGRQVSPTGRTKTLPADDGATFRFATASCQAWYHGHFTAYRHLVAEDLDAVVFLGDYIYEYGITSANRWRAGAAVAPEHSVEIQTLEQFRLRYSLFKTDPHLQAAHAKAPWIVTWDDHEVQNNYGADGSQYGVLPEHFVHLRAVGYRAFYENLPVSLSTLPEGPDSTVYRRSGDGGLVRFHVLDTRQYRDPLPVDAADQNREDRTILGADQEAWLYDGLAASPARWNVIANGVTVAAITTNRTDQWDGYPANRRRLLAAMRTTNNPVVLTGDIHKHVAAELKADFGDPASATVGVELICTSIASDGDGAPTDAYTPDWVQHPYVKLYDGRRGYVHVTLTGTAMTSEFKIVPWVEADADAPLETVARFVTPAGCAGSGASRMSGRHVRTVTGLRAQGRLGSIVLDWTPVPWDTVVDHYAVYAAADAADVEPSPQTLLAKTVYPHFVHSGLGGNARRFAYRVVTVDAAGARSRPSAALAATSQVSVTTSGTPLAVVGDFDGKGLEFALSPNGYNRYPATFPDGVDFRVGTDAPGTGWSYLHPGPTDSWAGRRTHTFRLRFDLPSVPAGEVWLAIWLIDSHATTPGSAVLDVNAATVDRLRFERGATRGSLEGDTTVPGTRLRPSYLERPLPSGLLAAGENVLTLVKDEGSWIAWDAIGLFAT